MSGINQKLLRRTLVTILLVLGLVLTIRLTHYLVISNAYQQLQQQSHRQLSGLVTFLNGMLQRFESMPQLLSQSALLKQLLTSPQDKKAALTLNQYLERVATTIRASDIYLTDDKGLVLAASNWDQPNSFVGGNYSFRPYFKQAIKGHQGRYFAVGTISNRRGYYFSYPVTIANRIRGVIVVKVNVAEIEQYHAEVFADSDSHFLITADDGVIFLSDQPKWRMKTLGQMSAQQRQLLTSGKRYANRVLSELSTRQISPSDYPNRSRFKVIELENGTKEVTKMLSHQRKMTDAGWMVHIWLPLDSIKQVSIVAIFLSGTCYLLVIMALFYGLERWRNITHLRNARAELEQRVEQRTSDLSASNKLLRAQIEQRKKAQQQLKTTQEQLIQAAKLALIGEMSASINHEINQPLTALRSYSQNAKTLLQRNMPDKAAENLEIIKELIDRLASIVGQFKNFTRKSVQNNSPLEIRACVEQAHTIVSPQLKQQGISADFEIPATVLYARGDNIRLEQVLVNLMTNAAQAMIFSDKKKLWLKVTALDDSMTIELRDSGPGILETEFNALFEPFYTNRRCRAQETSQLSEHQSDSDQGPGLGLGLSICKRIIESMDGKIAVSNHPQGGAVFSINLPRYQPDKEPNT